MKDWIWGLIYFFWVFLLGVFVGTVVVTFFYPNIVDGLWMNNRTPEQVKTIAYNQDPNGDWICINIRGMSWKRALEVCQHEIGHDMFHEKFAEICEKDFDKCSKLLEEENG